MEEIQKPPKSIPIARAKEIAQSMGYDELIIVGVHYQTGTQSVATYGITKAACENAAKGGNAVKKLLNWPEEKCHAVPNRLKKDK